MIGIVLLAAGQASRFGSPKQLALIDGVPMVRHAACIAASLELPMCIVTGAHRDAVEAVLDDFACIYHPGWSHGMGGSIAAGVRALRLRHQALSGVMILLADQPRITRDDLQRFLDTHGRMPESILVSTHAAMSGPPCLFPHRDLAALAQLEGTQGARRLWQDDVGRVIALPMPHAAHDIDTPGDLAAWCPTDSLG